MNKKIVLTLAGVVLSTLLYVGCKKDSDDSTPATCTDGILNGTETGIDCGGTCAACSSCSDSIQNGAETDIDCGGASCLPCAAKSMTATISGVGSFVADTALNNTDSTFDAMGGYTTYRIFAPSGASAAYLIDLTVRFTNSLASIQTNVDYNAGNVGGIFTALVYKQTTGGVTTTFNTTIGKINFSKINHVAHTVSGTFSFTCNAGGVTRTISNGVFPNLKLN